MALANLIQPWLLARVVLGVAAAVLLVVALRTAWRVLRHWRVGATTEGQLALERRAELAAAIVQVALVFAILGLALTVLAADRLSGSVRGAMCAYGVLDSTPGGWIALATSAIAAAACALWVVLHRLDLRLATPALTRRKMLALFVVAPLVWFDLAATLGFVSRLDLSMVTSCCSAELDVAAAAVDYGSPAFPRGTIAAVALAAAVAATLAALWARARPGAASAWTTAVLSLAAAAAAIPAVLWYVAPHVYEVPHHHCPFCLLRADAGGIGWLLFAALFAATALGAGLGIVAAHARTSADPQATHAIERSLARAVAVSWFAAIAVGAIPVVRYWFASGGASLFGAGG